MLFVYGSMMPLRLLEEIRFWKMQEREHTEVIRALVPDLEPQYVALLERWEHVLAQTETSAQQWIEALVRSPGAAADPHVCRSIDQLLARSKAESREFVRQLYLLQQQSKPVKSSLIVKTVLLHIIRESEYFLGVLQAVTSSSHWIQPRPEHLAAPAEQQSDEGAALQTAPKDQASTAIRTNQEEQAKLAVLSNQPSPSNHPDSKTRRTETTALRNDSPHYLTATQEGAWSSPPPQPGAAPADAAARPVPIGGHKLPPLPYAYNALEPYIDEETMRLHHDKHHLSYVEGLNKAEKMLAKARQNNDFELVKHWERELAFHGAGHYLHTIFWNAMKPKGGGKPSGALAAELDRTFGSFDAFKKQFSQAAEKVEGGGWTILVWSPRSHRVEILQAEKHQNLSQWDVIPLLPLDVWEHAYYLKYQNARAKYIEAWWNVVNWDEVSARYMAASKLKWPPF